MDVFSLFLDGSYYVMCNTTYVWNYLPLTKLPLIKPHTQFFSSCHLTYLCGKVQKSPWFTYVLKHHERRYNMSIDGHVNKSSECITVSFAVPEGNYSWLKFDSEREFRLKKQTIQVKQETRQRRQRRWRRRRWN